MSTLDLFANPAAQHLWSRAYSQRVDALSSKDFLIPSLALMESAGRAIADTVMRSLQHLHRGDQDVYVLILAGPGNNGGDALVAARHLWDLRSSDEQVQTASNFHLHIFLLQSPDQELSSNCQQQLAILKALQIPVTRYAHASLAAWRNKVNGKMQKSKPKLIILDGVLGLGFHGILRPDSLAAQALDEAAHLHACLTIAIDTPSGLDVDDGDPPKIPLSADITVTFGAKKPAHVISPARDNCGETICVGIGFPQRALLAAKQDDEPQINHIDAAKLIAQDPWQKLPRSAHKYDRGHVLVIGGSPGKTGAPLLAGLAALRTGAGWASIAMSDAALQTMHGEVPRELTFESLFQGETVEADKLAAFIKERRVKAVVIGPGCMQSPLTPTSIQTLIDFTEQDGFVVLDAGATQGIATLLQTRKAHPERWLLTPHPGEWSRLGSEFSFNPLRPEGRRKTLALAQQLGISLLHKGATPVLFPGAAGLPIYVTDEGTIALARAGSGDLLAGAAAAHGAIGLDSIRASLRAQVLVAWAAILAGKDVGEQSVLAQDILHALGQVKKPA